MILIMIKFKINLIPINRTQVLKRSMMTRRGVGCIPVPIRPTHGIVQNPTAQLRDHAVQKRHLTYHVDNTDVQKSSHEQAQSNPVLQFTKKNKKVKVMQHYFVGRDTCEETECKNKLCDKPCAPIMEKVYVAHGTHNSTLPGAIKVDTTTDFNNTPNYDTMGKNVDINKTTNLNNNKSMRQVIHNATSTTPTIQENQGSDDFTNNIN